MGYILEVRNRFNYGHSTFKCQSLSEVRKILNDNLFDGEVKRKLVNSQNRCEKSIMENLQD